MTFYKHTIPAEKNTKSAHKLEELHEREGLLQVFHSTAIHDYADTWLATFK
jgi:hypothetical protein